MGRDRGFPLWNGQAYPITTLRENPAYGCVIDWLRQLCSLRFPLMMDHVWAQHLITTRVNSLLQNHSDNPAFKTPPFVTSESELRRVWCRGRKTLTKGQHMWVRYMLNLWGSLMGGETAPEDDGGVSVIGRLMIRAEWDQEDADRIIQAVHQLHDLGLRGDDLFAKAKEMVNPKSTTKYWIEKAQANDDAKFIERVMIKTIGKNSPMYAVAILHHCSHLNSHRTAKALMQISGCDLQLARKRITWCEKILEEVLYYALKHELERELNSAIC